VEGCRQGEAQGGKKAAAMAENNVENNRAFPFEIDPEKTPLPHILR